MKLLHTADLHIGKIVNDFSMLQDQKYILEQIKQVAIDEQVTGLLLAGDIYDRAIPQGEAVTLLNDFLTSLAEKGILVFLISGNHDSPERLSFGEMLLRQAGIVIAGNYKETLTTYTIEEESGAVEIVLLPFVKPARADARTSGEAVGKLLKGYWETQSGQERKRRVLMTHCFVTDGGREPELSDSETTIHVGGLDNVEASLFEGFDYVALGHIHKPQQIGSRPVYYAGSPLKYSFGEWKQTKSVLLITLKEEGVSEVKQCPLLPLREMRKIKGTLQKLMEEAGKEPAGKEDYIQAQLTDEGELIDPIGTLRSVYPNIMQIVREEGKEEQTASHECKVMSTKNPEKLFEDFYELVREKEMEAEEKKIIADVIRTLKTDG